MSKRTEQEWWIKLEMILMDMEMLNTVGNVEKVIFTRSLRERKNDDDYLSIVAGIAAADYPPAVKSILVEWIRENW